MLNERNTLLEDDGIEEEILVEEECSVAQAMWGDILGNIENQTDLQNALDAKQDSLTEAQLNAVNSGITSEKVTTYDGYADQIARKADQSALNAETIARGEADTALDTRIDNEALARQQADNGLQSQIDAITSKSDVVDVVANYAALQAYDTSTLGNNDVVKVLDDETHEDALTYYRWSTTTQTWSYIGQEAPYYSKGQMDVKLAEKQDKLTAGANIQIQNGTISATDTTYTAGNGLNLNGTEFSANTDVLATKEDLEGYYTKPETDNLLAPKLEAEVVTELPTTGAEGKLYLTPKAHTTQTATGNPITATVAEEAGTLESFQLDGDTFQQTYTGKNLYNKANYLDGVYINASTGAVGSGSGFVTCYAQISPSTQYTVSKLSTSRFIIAESSSIPAVGDTLNVLSATAQTSEVKTITTSANVAYLAIMVKSSSDTLTIEQILDSIQIEAGSTSTSYEPFVGGQPSPSPDYPQPIQTVTGEQTVTINSTAYPISLGSIELCKLDTYQDYIWKDGEDWKVHKATGNITFDGSERAWQKIQMVNNWRYYLGVGNIISPQSTTGEVIGLCSHFSKTTPSGQWTSPAGSQSFIINNSANLNSSIGFTIGDATDKLAEFKTWLSENTPSVRYALATPTDTTITNTSLIAQLEAIRTASLQNGTNTITNSATAPNLAGDMEVGYYGFNPRNRYDKFIWLDLNNNYEQIGS